MKTKSDSNTPHISLGKRGDFNFVLLFALIAGAAILVLAIYGAVKFGTSNQFQQSAELAKKIDILTDPLQAGFAATTTSTITFPKDTKVSNICSFDNDFGKNALAVQSRSSAGDPWLNDTIPVSIRNKYIFSEYEEGKKFYVMSKPFEFPFKIADLLFVTTKNYCLVNPPEDIAREMLSLNSANIGVLIEGNDTCSEDSVKVCFDYGLCDIYVVGECTGYGCKSDFDYGTVRKGNENLYYVGNLLYGAIFSNKETYDCNVNRLLFRLSNIANIFSAKTELMNTRGCNTNMKPAMGMLAELASTTTSENIKDIYFSVESIKELNDGSLSSYSSECALW